MDISSYGPIPMSQPKFCRTQILIPFSIVFRSTNPSPAVPLHGISLFPAQNRQFPAPILPLQDILNALVHWDSVKFGLGTGIRNASPPPPS